MRLESNNGTSGWLPKSLLAIAGALLLWATAMAADNSLDSGIYGSAKQIPAAVLERISAGTAQDVIVLYDDRDIETEAGAYRNRSGKRYDDAKILALKAGRYQQRK